MYEYGGSTSYKNPKYTSSMKSSYKINKSDRKSKSFVSNSGTTSMVPTSTSIVKGYMLYQGVIAYGGYGRSGRLHEVRG